MTTKHTQGKWNSKKWIAQNAVDGCEWVVTDSRGHGIVKFLTKGNNNKAEANAKLIASAPALLEALIDIDKYCSKNLCTKHRCMITSAIKKATE